MKTAVAYLKTCSLHFKVNINQTIYLGHRRTSNFFSRGGGKPFAQKILSSCPNFYETVETKQGPYDAIT